MAPVGRAVGAARIVSLNGRRAAAVATTCLALLALALAAPQPAQAIDILGFFTGSVTDWGKDMMKVGFEWLSSVNTGMLTNSFTSLFSGDGDGTTAGPGLAEMDSAYRKVAEIASGLTGTLGYSILAIATIVQICKMAGRADGNQQLASVKELAFILIYFAVFKALIDNAVPFCEAFYNVFNNLAEKYFSTGGIGVDNASALADSAAKIAGDNPGLVFVLGLIVVVTCFVAVIISYAVVFFRSVQIYLYTAFAPIALPLLALDETRGFGTGFIRNYIALLLSGLIIAFMIIVFPLLLQAAASTGDGLASFAGTLAVCGVLCLGLARSGGMAKEILGG